QRFFVRSQASTGTCDVGAYESGAARDTTPPTCVVTRSTGTGSHNAGEQQDVTLQDSGSGIGPQWSGTPNGQHGSTDAVTDVTITNGSVAFTPFAAPSRTGLVLTATRATGGSVTRWSFTGTDWAGNATDCR